MRAEAGAPPADFLSGGGAMGALVRAHDWTATPLGPSEAWPPSLRTAVGMVLGSKFPACLAWGPGLTTIHNDAFRPILGAKPEALGRPFNEVWSEAWHELALIAERALAGEATFIEDFPLAVERGGHPEEAFFTFCYSPVRDEAGAVAGFLDTVVETTGKVLAERRQAFLLDLEERLRGLADPHDVTLAAAGALGGHLGAVRAGYGVIDAAGETVTVERDWTDGTIAGKAGEVRLLDAFGPAVIAELRAGRTLVVEDCLIDPRAAGKAHAATWASIGTRSLMVVPLLKGGQLTALLYVHESEPRRWGEADVRLAEDTAHRTWPAVQRARAEAELRESEARLLALVSATSDVVYRMSPDWAEMDRLDGRGFLADTPASSRGWLDDYVPPDDQARVRAAIGDAIARRSVFELEHRTCRVDGSLGWTLSRAVPLLDDAGEITEWFGTASDVTERKRAEEANARLAAIVASTTDAIIGFAAEDGRILAWNKGAEELFGYAEAEALGGPVGLLVPPGLLDGDQTGVFRRAMNGVRVHEHETVRVAKLGERIPVCVTASRMLAPDGRVIGVASIIRDLRHRKAAEARQALLAHEVDHRSKNALAVVQTMLRLTRADDVPSFVRTVEGRVAALARAQTLLAEERWSGADLRSLLRGELAPFLADQRADLDGPTVVLPPGTVQPLAMAAHELATNAAKHGALSVPEGQLSVSWHLESGAAGAALRLRWVEAGGPSIAGPPARYGFGSRVLHGTVRDQLGGTVSLAWGAAGLVCEMELPLDSSSVSAGAMDLGKAAVD